MSSLFEDKETREWREKMLVALQQLVAEEAIRNKILLDTYINEQQILNELKKMNVKQAVSLIFELGTPQ